MNGRKEKRAVRPDEPPRKRVKGVDTDNLKIDNADKQQTNGHVNGNHSNPTEQILDPFCDPENPVKVSFHDVSAAAYKIKGGVQKTPCLVKTII